MSQPAKPARKKRHVPRPDIGQKLLDAAEAVIRKDGYAAATVRRIDRPLKGQIATIARRQEGLAWVLRRRPIRGHNTTACPVSRQCRESRRAQLYDQ